MASVLALSLARCQSFGMSNCTVTKAESFYRYFVSINTKLSLKKKEAVFLKCQKRFVKEENHFREKSNGLVKSVPSSGPLFSSGKQGVKKLLDKNLDVSISHSKFHVSTPRTAIPPVVWIIVRPLTKFLAVIFGRGFRKWWQSLPKDKKTLFMANLKRNRVKITVTVSVFSAGGYYYYYSHLQETPITGRIRFVAFTSEQFNKIAQYEFKQQCEMYKDQILSPSHPVYQQVVRVANRLLHSNRDLQQVYGKEWTVTVVEDSGMKNAFVLPSGNIFVFTGMIDLCSNDDQLGMILGHEMAHAILSHAAEQVSFLQLIDLAVIIPLAAIWAFLPSDSLAFITHWFFGWVTDLLLRLPYGRALEVEADDVGIQLAAKACFDVREASTFWMKMAVMEELQGDQEVEWLSTHPGHEKRHAHLDDLMEKAVLLRKKCACPKLPDLDPRRGIEAFRRALLASTEKKPVAVLLKVPDMASAATSNTKDENGKSEVIHHQK